MLCKLLAFIARNSVFFSPFAVIVRSVLDENGSVLCLIIQNETDSVLLPVKTLNRLVEWGLYALSASKAIFRARTYNCNLFSPVMRIT